MRTAFSLVPEKWVGLSICFVAAFAGSYLAAHPDLAAAKLT
jgi:hypothetical protein